MITLFTEVSADAFKSVGEGNGYSHKKLQQKSFFAFEMIDFCTSMLTHECVFTGAPIWGSSMEGPGVAASVHCGWRSHLGGGRD